MGGIGLFVKTVAGGKGRGFYRVRVNSVERFFHVVLGKRSERLSERPVEDNPYVFFGYLERVSHTFRRVILLPPRLGLVRNH